LLQELSRGGEHRREALGELAEMYWQPCCRYVAARFHGSPEASQELVQAFFLALIEQDILSGYEPDRGSFRPFLRACLDHFVLKDRRWQAREKRGGKAKLLPLEVDAEVADGDPDPEELFHREWQRRMFALAIEDLRKSCEQTGRDDRFRVFAAYDLAEDRRPTYEELAALTGLPVTTVTNDLAWARRELRRMIEIRLTGVTASEGERRRELRSLFGGTRA
jgi:RNA polymerase sigma factor (sigma-70 family)